MNFVNVCQSMIILIKPELVTDLVLNLAFGVRSME